LTPVLLVIGCTQSEPDLKNFLYLVVVIGVINPSINFNISLLKELKASALGMFGKLEVILIEFMFLSFRVAISNVFNLLLVLDNFLHQFVVQISHKLESLLFAQLISNV
jgi:hypothetical protein